MSHVILLRNFYSDIACNSLFGFGWSHGIRSELFVWPIRVVGRKARVVRVVRGIVRVVWVMGRPVRVVVRWLPVRILLWWLPVGGLIRPLVRRMLGPLAWGVVGVVPVGVLLPVRHFFVFLQSFNQPFHFFVMFNLTHPTRMFKSTEFHNTNDKLSVKDLKFISIDKSLIHLIRKYVRQNKLTPSLLSF